MTAIYELAKSLGITNRDLVTKVRALGIDANNHMSRLNDKDVERVRNAVVKERDEKTMQRRVLETVIRRRARDGSFLSPVISPDPHMAAPMTAIYELAKSLGIANKDLVTKVRALGIDANNHMSRLNDEDVERVRRALAKEREEKTVQQRVNDTVIRRRTRDGSFLSAVIPPDPGVVAADRHIKAIDTKERQESTVQQRAIGRATPSLPRSKIPPPPLGVGRVEGNRRLRSIQLEAKIGEGAYADVWRATDKLGRKVAVKILRKKAPYYFNAMQHARALARTKHNNIVTVYSLETVIVPDSKEEVDGIIMELIEGPTLHDKLLQEPMDQRDALSICNGLIDGLEHIHSVGLVHNDLHTKNVLIAERHVKIIDILYTGSLINLTTGTREDRFRRDKRDLTTMLFDIAGRSQLSTKDKKEFGLLLLDSTMNFESIRSALQIFTGGSVGSIIPPGQARNLSTINSNHEAMAERYYATLLAMQVEGGNGSAIQHSAICNKLGLDPRGPSGEGYLIMMKLLGKRVEQVQQFSRDAATQWPWTDWLVRVR